MLQEKIKEIAEDNDWQFRYGKDHWQNLQDNPDDADLPFADRAKYLNLLWVDTTDFLNSYGATEGYTYDGQFFFSVRSKISDPSYDFKYETHIRGLMTLLEGMKSEFNDCDGLTLKYWKASEADNVYDTNMDGLMVTFKIEATA